MTLLSDLHPWLNDPWRQIQAARERLPHALLIGGPVGLGKFNFSQTLAAGLLCKSPLPEGVACGQCKSCHLFKAGNHPDFRLTRPKEDASLIVVDQVRELIGFLSLRPHTSDRKLVVLAPAETMNINAANSLLKILEEPPADSILILVSNNAQALSATVRSRCTQLTLSPPSTEDGVKWLQSNGLDSLDRRAAQDLLAAAGGAPLRARELEEQGFVQARKMMLEDLRSLQARSADPVSCAVRWKTLGASFCLGWLSGLIADLVQLSYVHTDSARLNNPSQHQTLREMSNNTNPSLLFELFEKSVEAENLSATPLDDTLLLEDILIGWSRISN